MSELGEVKSVATDPREINVPRLFDAKYHSVVVAKMGNILFFVEL